MSELITRRTFLKATGAAALVAAAGSMLVGCGEGYGATPGNPTLPTLDTSNYKGLPSCSVVMGAFSGTFESNSVYESDGCRHYYLYTALGFQSVDTSFSISKNIAFRANRREDGNAQKSVSSVPAACQHTACGNGQCGGTSGL